METLIFGFDIKSVVGNNIWHLALGLVAFDIATGLLAAGVEKKINSSINFVGLIKKAGIFVALAFLVFVDAFINADGYIIQIGVWGIVVYEGLSIIENFSRIGINLNFLTKYFDPNKVGKGDK
ncbi:toxin secretion/phage lysis holin [Bacillus oleivorans]|uniref:Toxin secretion/phage lysis holin n=1 Tax=Bacillus oleivorans TaxID=1448271 RepID=A0A285CL81_9BACI|nr:phage holin family protein [Bacillus oleivorans]SNX67818.1 toxin secretion/phage lysis holin [Bacillus oleivorans]SNX75307.1 toxin secretion/phage lysis holin [Bacillus oleivorans]